MKLALLLFALHTDHLDVDHLIQMQTATLRFEEHLAETFEEREAATKKREAWEAILRIIGKQHLAKPPVQEIQLQQPEPVWA